GMSECRDYSGGRGPDFGEVRGDHLVVAGGVHCDGVRVELAPLGQMLLGNFKGRSEDSVQVVLSLGRGAVSPGSHELTLRCGSRRPSSRARTSTCSVGLRFFAQTVAESV